MILLMKIFLTIHFSIRIICSLKDVNRAADSVAKRHPDISSFMPVGVMFSWLFVNLFNAAFIAGIWLWL